MKHAAEEHLRASGADWTIVRATAFGLCVECITVEIEQQKERA
jgi:hypothetical protein